MRKWVSLFISILLLAAVLLLHHNVVNDALNTLPEAALAAASPSLSVKAFSELDVTAAVTPVMTGDGYIKPSELQRITPLRMRLVFWPHHEIRRF